MLGSAALPFVRHPTSQRLCGLCLLHPCLSVPTCISAPAAAVCIQPGAGHHSSRRAHPAGWQLPCLSGAPVSAGSGRADRAAEGVCGTCAGECVCGPSVCRVLTPNSLNSLNSTHSTTRLNSTSLDPCRHMAEGSGVSAALHFTACALRGVSSHGLVVEHRARSPACWLSPPPHTHTHTLCPACTCCVITHTHSPWAWQGASATPPASITTSTGTRQQQQQWGGGTAAALLAAAWTAAALGGGRRCLLPWTRPP